MTENHDTHDPVNAAGFHLLQATEGHYLIGETKVEGDAARKIWEERVTYVDGANMDRNEYGPPQYANFFFFITGFHGFHVFSGVVINFIVLIMAIQGVFHRRGHYEMIEKAGLYWHFVDLVWVFVFTFFYLL
jgi:cytochrome c oxidase subunit 3